MCCRWINVVRLTVYLISRISVGCCVAQCAPGGRQSTRWLYHCISASKFHLGSTSRVSVPLNSSVRTPWWRRQTRESVGPVLYYRYLWDSWRLSLNIGDGYCKQQQEPEDTENAHTWLLDIGFREDTLFFSSPELCSGWAFVIPWMSVVRRSSSCVNNFNSALKPLARFEWYFAGIVCR